MNYSRFYSAGFLVVELIQAFVGLITLTLYMPTWTIAFARWYHRRQYQ